VIYRKAEVDSTKILSVTAAFGLKQDAISRARQLPQPHRQEFL